MESMLNNFNVYDIVCGGAVIIGVLYGLSSGILSMIKPLISVIIARAISGTVRGMLSMSDLTTTINQAAADKTGLPADMKIIQLGSSMVADAVISVLAFVLSYIIIRIVLSMVFSMLRCSRFGIAYKLNQTAGAVVGFIVVGIFIYYIAIGATALAQMGFGCAKDMAEGLSNSLVARGIIHLFDSTVNVLAASMLS